VINLTYPKPPSPNNLLSGFPKISYNFIFYSSSFTNVGLLRISLLNK